MPANLKLEKTTAASLANQQRKFDLNFSYSTSHGKIAYSHSYKNGTSTFEVIYCDRLPDDLQKNNLFTAIDDGSGKPAYFFCVSVDDSGQLRKLDRDAETVARAKRNIARQRIRIGKFQQNAAEAHPPSSDDQQPPTEAMATAELARLIAKKNIHFFTGAGLSVPSIPDWNGLMDAMGYEKKRSDEENLQKTAANLDANSQAVLMEIHNTHKAFFSGKTTAGHRAIGNISEATQRAILTDNRDLLHQISGFEAVHVCQISDFQKRPWQPEITCDAQQIDGLIVCGMGGDRRRFIEWLKKENPNAVIINMNLENTLAHEVRVDYFMKGDAQKLLLQLENEFTHNKTIQELDAKLGIGSKVSNSEVRRLKAEKENQI